MEILKLFGNKVDSYRKTIGEEYNEMNKFYYSQEHNEEENKSITIFQKIMQRFLVINYVSKGYPSKQAGNSSFFDGILFSDLFEKEPKLAVSLFVEYLVFNKYEDKCDMDFLINGINYAFQSIDESNFPFLYREEIKYSLWYPLLNRDSKELIN